MICPSFYYVLIRLCIHGIGSKDEDHVLRQFHHHPYPLRSRCHRRDVRWGSFGKELYGGDNLIHGTLHITHPMGRVGVQLLTVGLDGNLDDIALGSESDNSIIVCQPFKLAFVEVSVHMNPLSVKNQP